jgi:hypothetical protein
MKVLLNSSILLLLATCALSKSKASISYNSTYYRYGGSYDFSSDDSGSGGGVTDGYVSKVTLFSIKFIE